jgi:hypothetical protein
MDYYLKSTSEGELKALLLSANILVASEEVLGENGEVIYPASQYPAEGLVIDYVGTIYKPTGNMINVGAPSHLEYPEMVPLDGFHANLRGALTEEQEAAIASIVLPIPANPVRIWA